MIQQLFQSFDYLNVAQGLETTSCDREILPDFNFELASEDEKASTKNWSITPIPAGGIAATRGELDPGIDIEGSPSEQTVDQSLFLETHRV